MRVDVAGLRVEIAGHRILADARLQAATREFVGLMVPHIVRQLVGADHRRVLPCSVLLGAIVLLAADLVARLALAPAELPLGIVTAGIGAPFFVWLLAGGRVGRGRR